MKRLYLRAVDALEAVYNKEGYNVGSTEWNVYRFVHNDELWQHIAIGGTNEPIDWLWNFALFSRQGIKFGCWLSVQRIMERFKRIPRRKLMISCHSKSGPTGAELARRLNADLCISFCPAPGHRKAFMLQQCTMFIDPDDPVPKLGQFSFKHPICRKVKLPDDPGLWKIGDHFLDHIREFLVANDG